MEHEFFNKLTTETTIDKQFYEKFFCYLDKPSDMIAFDDVKDWIGYKQKRTITEILFNKKYDYVNGIDYKFEKIKKEEICKPINEIYMTIDTLKSICLMAPTEKGQQFRKYYIEMEKLYRKYVSTIVQNQLTNPIAELNKYDFDISKYANKEVLYLIFIKDDIYKFGVTANIKKRLSNHDKFLEYKYVIKCWDCSNRSVSKQVEDDIKKYIKVNKLNSVYKGNTEIVKTINIDGIVKIFDVYVSNRIKEYKNLFKSVQIEQKIEMLEKIAEVNRIQKGILDAQVDIMNKSNNMKNNNIKININLDNTGLINVNSLIQETPEESNQNEPTEKIDANSVAMIENMENSIQKCRHCSQNKPKKEFGWNELNKCYFKQCIQCREKCRIQDKERRDKKIVCNIETMTNEEMYGEEISEDNNNTGKEKHIQKIQKNKVYYDKNSLEIISQKKLYREKRMNSINNDPTKKYCKKCNTIKNIENFDINKRTKEQYKQCDLCRAKET